ncbi:MAG: tetratricopeptide repeat protein [Deltaproteobacteria bacterium]|nr:tetratricopeptide repeat protein [Deltaproteobacteria bacterium]
MKKTNVIIVVLVTFALGFVTGLLWAAFKGTPPGLAPVRQDISSPGQEFPEEVRTRLTQLETRLQDDPANFALLVEAGNFCFDHDLYDKAKKYYQMALKISPNKPDVLTDLGIAYRRTGDPQKAASLFRQAHQIDPTHQNSVLNLGIVLLHDLNDKEGALKAWEDYLALNPKDERAATIRKVVSQLRENL